MDPETLTARATLKLSGVPVRVEVTVPTRPVRLGEMLPTFRSLATAIVHRAEAAVEAEGLSVSCRAGCGACCRQLVPIARVEARQLRDLVESMPEPRWSEVRARFAEAGRRLEEAGLRDAILEPGRLPLERARTLGLDYFRLGSPARSSKPSPARSTPTARSPAASTSSPPPPRTARAHGRNRPLRPPARPGVRVPPEDRPRRPRGPLGPPEPRPRMGRDPPRRPPPARPPNGSASSSAT